MKKYITLLTITLFCSLYVQGQVEIAKVDYLDNDSFSTCKLIHFLFDSSGYTKAIYKSDSFYFSLSPVGHFRFDDYNYIQTNNDIVYVLTDSTGQYLMSKNRVRAFGPLDGKISLISNKQSSRFAFSMAYTDLIVLYVHDTLVGEVKGKEFANYFEYHDWCAISDTGVTIYYTYSKRKFRLFVDFKLIDSSDRAFKNMAVNDKGQFSYVKYEKNAVYLKTSDTTLGPFDPSAYDRIIYYCGIQNDGSYYYEMPSETRKFWVINNQVLYGQLDYLKFTGNGHYMYFYKEDTGVQSRPWLDMKHFDDFMWGRRPLDDNEIELINHPYKLNIDGKIIQISYNKVEVPVIDSMGYYAFCGIRDFMMYPVINGIESPKPLSRYGVRPKAMYIGVYGDTYNMYTTPDSSYLYHNNRLLFTASKGHDCSEYLRKKLVRKPNKLKLYPGQIEYKKEMFNDNDCINFSSWFAAGAETVYEIDPATDQEVRRVPSATEDKILKSGEMNGRSYYITTRNDSCYRIFVDFALA